MTGRAIDSHAAEPRIRRRQYKTRAGRDRAANRYGSRVESIGAGTSGWFLWVYDLDEFGQPPVFFCPVCGREIDD